MDCDTGVNCLYWEACGCPVDAVIGAIKDCMRYPAEGCCAMGRMRASWSSDMGCRRCARLGLLLLVYI